MPPTTVMVPGRAARAHDRPIMLALRRLGRDKNTTPWSSWKVAVRKPRAFTVVSWEGVPGDTLA
jgi:hypothetical protein